MKEVVDKIKKSIKDGDVETIKKLMEEHNLEIKNGKIVSKDQEQVKAEYAFWNQRQLIKKIQLNSLYGALTNEGSKFFDQRMGQSITLTGRCIAKHMAGTINQILTGKFDHQGRCVIYGDTDSCYFSASPILPKLEADGFEVNDDNIVNLYDTVAAATNETFAGFMRDTFNCHDKRASRIKANREICARTGLFIKKKKYAALVFDNEGTRKEKLKIMGLDTQRADTPGYVQDFLKDVLMKILSGTEEQKVIEMIKRFRMEFRSKEPWFMGTPKRCNGLTKYSNLEDRFPGSNLPGHIRAAYNWNKIKRAMGDHHSRDILDGSKTIVCKLKKSPFGIASIAYPIDQTHLPDWFKQLPFDEDEMEFTLIDKKLNNLIGLLDLNLQETKRHEVVSNLFSFE